MNSLRCAIGVGKMGGRVKDRGSLGRVLVRFLTVIIPQHRRSCVVVCLSYGGCRLGPGTSSSVSTTVLSALVAAISSLRCATAGSQHTQ